MAGGPLMRLPPDGNRFPLARSPLERSLLPSAVLTMVILLGCMLLFRLRLPPLPYSLVALLGLWVICFVVVFIWQVQRYRRRR